ncbi:hypothetical protein C1Y40_01051 [Mycobacterium talmoniae]|nr:hypothetical protein C1Y40_01051 [Mycobacterium talmoniae]
MPNVEDANLAAVSTPTGAPTVVSTVDEDGRRRISVFGPDRAEICGAFQPVDRPYWLMYVTTRIVDGVDRSQPNRIPRRIPLPTLRDVYQWLELIAGLYTRAASQ